MSKIDLSAENNWWKKGGLWDDPDLAAVQRSPLHYRPMPILPTECHSSAIITLRGPRRVGKTVALKLLIAELLESHSWDPYSIVWNNVDLLRNAQDLANHLLKVCKASKPKLLIIDEITTIKNWQLAIKKLRDDGTLGGMCVIVTGSSAHDLKTGAERMAGRRGLVEFPDRYLLPISYETFITQLKNHNLKLTPQDMQSLYLQCGGFPFRIESLINSLKQEQTYDPLSNFAIFDDVLFYEFTRRRLDRTIGLEVIQRLSQLETTACSLEAFAKPTSFSKDTAKRYLDALGDAFLLATIYSFDSGRGRVAMKKDKKYIWIDPALGYAAQYLKHGAAAKEETRAEWTVGAHLLRQHEHRLWEGLTAPRHVFTWKSSKGNEIDFLVVDHVTKTKFPVEVKYQNNIEAADFQSMEKAFGQGLLVTKDIILEREKSSAMVLRDFLAQKHLSTKVPQIANPPLALTYSVKDTKVAVRTTDD
jgi:predicted AAA+ superfamily ATPase